MLRFLKKILYIFLALIGFLAIFAGLDTLDSYENNDRGNVWTQKCIDYAKSEPEKGVEFCNEAMKYGAKAIFTSYFTDNISLANKYYWRGTAYENSRKFEKALDDYSKAIKYDSKNYENYLVRASLVHGQLSNYEFSIEDLNKAIELNPSSSISFNNRGWSYYELKKYSEAIKDFDKALAIDSKVFESYLGRAKANLALGFKEKAIYDYEQALQNALKEDDIKMCKRALCELQGEGSQYCKVDVKKNIDANLSYDIETKKSIFLEESKKYNFAQARKDGYTDTEIIDFVTSKKIFSTIKFDAMKKDGYTDTQIIESLIKWQKNH